MTASAAKPLLKVLCGRERQPHMLGRVFWRQGALVLDFKGAVRYGASGNTSSDFRAVEQSFVLEREPEVWVAFDAYCSPCRARFVVVGSALIDAVDRGLKAYALQSQNPDARWREKLYRARPELRPPAD